MAFALAVAAQPKVQTSIASFSGVQVRKETRKAEQATSFSVVARKEGIHPEFHFDAKVVCNGEHVLTIGGIKSEYKVDVWSGNHPFFTGQQKVMDSVGRVERFYKKYGKIGETPAAKKD